MKSSGAWVLLLWAVSACGSSDADAGAGSSGAGGGAGNGGASASGGASGDGGAGGSGGDAAIDPTLVQTDKGPLRGVLAGGTRKFLGIPYAAPPVGDLRWKAPVESTAWTEPRDAAVAGAGCAQFGPLGPPVFPGTSEDCLFLNVWAPWPAPATPAPVMVWIHGGGFTFGTGKDFDGQKLAEASGAVIVTINYRLGPLGFLAHDALAAEDAAHHATGNYGLEDERAALSWVKRNAAAFGGDPGAVTLFGESAGGMSTCLHLLSPPSNGLFQRAIIESGACTGLAVTGKTAARAQGVALAAALGCNDAATVVACLRGKTSDEVLLALPLKPGLFQPTGVTWFPNIDGYDVPGDPAALFAAGSFTKMPVLLGSNRNEGTLFTRLTPVASEAEFLAIAEGLWPGHGASIVARYPVASFASVGDAVAEALGDGWFVCTARRLSRLLTAAGSTPFVYQFAHAVDWPLIPGLGVFHSGELSYVFDTPINGTALHPEDQPLVDAVQGYWARMARTGDPNGAGATPWPAYDAATDLHTVLDLTVTTETDYKKAVCDFWDGVVEPL